MQFIPKHDAEEKPDAFLKEVHNYLHACGIPHNLIYFNPKTRNIGYKFTGPTECSIEDGVVISFFEQQLQHKLYMDALIEEMRHTNVIYDLNGKSFIKGINPVTKEPILAMPIEEIVELEKRRVSHYDSDIPSIKPITKDSCTNNNNDNDDYVNCK